MFPKRLRDAYRSAEGGVVDDADALERWQQAGEAAIDQWIAEREAAGVPAQKMYDRLLELAED